MLREAPAPNATPNPQSARLALLPPAFRFPLVTPTRAVATAVRIGKHQARRCIWCGWANRDHGTRYAANRGHHPFEPSGYRPLRGDR